MQLRGRRGGVPIYIPQPLHAEFAGKRFEPYPAAVDFEVALCLFDIRESFLQLRRQFRLTVSAHRDRDELIHEEDEQDGEQKDGRDRRPHHYLFELFFFHVRVSAA